MRTLFAFFFLFLSVSEAAVSDKTLHELSQTRYWHVLLHWKNGQSEIDDPSFFLTKKRELTPLHELNATIRALQNDDDNISCRYPARIFWLREVLPELFAKKRFVCQELEERIAKVGIQNVTLVFPTAYMNSPASMFGHTFLRLDKDPHLPLVSEAVNYAARTAEENGLRYLYNGLFGGYRGYYSMLPYYKKIKEYAAMEQRDMWEYELDLNATEIRRLLYHLYELKGVYGDYYFFTKNCSYNLLWLLESAKIDTHLPDDFRFKVIPVDTIRSVKQRGLIGSVHFRGSKRRRMEALLRQIANHKVARKFCKTYDLKLLSDLNITQQALIVDLGVENLKFRRSHRKINKQNYITNLMKLLKYRSKLPTAKKLTIEKGVDPLRGHRSVRVAFWLQNGGRFAFSLKPAMHDMEDIGYGYIPGAYIDFFHLKFERSRFQRFDFVSVTSLAARDDFFKPISWKASVSVSTVAHKGYERFFSLAGGAGMSWKRAQTLWFWLAGPEVYVGSASIGTIFYRPVFYISSVRLPVVYATR